MMHKKRSHKSNEQDAKIADGTPCKITLRPSSPMGLTKVF